MSPVVAPSSRRARRQARLRARRLRIARIGTTVATLTTILVIASASPASAGPQPVMYGYVPLPADQFQAVMESVNAAATTTLDFTVGITNAGNSAVITYDHWEDGFEADPANPVQSTTEVWGDGNAANGDASTVCSSCSGDLLTPGDVFVLRNTITTPRDPAQIRWDGRDKVSSTRGFTLTAGGFSTLGSVLAGSASAYDTSKYGTDYVVPVGEDTATPSGSSPPFETSSVIVMAAHDNTTVNVDTDGNGTTDVTQTIDEGEVVFVNGGIHQGAHITSDQPVQVHEGTGDVGSSYESRWFTLFPTPLLTSDYLDPVGSSTANQETIVYLHNPGSSSLTVTPTCTSCAGTITITAHDTASFSVPHGEAVRFASGGDPFIAVGAMGAQSGANGGGADSSSTYDWGFTLVPTGLLTTQVVLGWAPGNSTNPPSSSAGDLDDDPVWVTTVTPTTVYVDFDGDPTTGTIAAADCVGSHHDLELTVGALESTKIADTGDGDMTGARIYTCDATKIAGAWGEDPATAPSGAPGFDAGYALVPSTVMVVDKTASLAVDHNGNGLAEPGDRLRYTVSIADAGSLSFTGVAIDDTLTAGLSYQANSTTFDPGSGATPIADDSTPPSATAFPLDEGGTALPDIAAGDTVVVSYLVDVDAATLPDGSTSVTNTATVTSNEADGSDIVTTPLGTADLSLSKSVTATPTLLGDDATFRLTVSNAGPDAAAGVEVTDLLPAGLAYVSNSPSAGTYDHTNGVWSVGTLASGASATLDLTATVTALSATNRAEVTASDAIDPDSQPAENTFDGGHPADQDDEASASVTVVPAADLSLTKSRTSGPDASGNTVFRLTLTNAGPSAAHNIAVTDHPPAGSSYVADTPSTGTFTSGNGTWDISTLASGASATLDVTYSVTTAPSANLAEVTAVDEADPDSQPTENALDTNHVPDQDDEASAAIGETADLSVTKSESSSPTHVGDTATFGIRIDNAGPTQATGVVVTDLLPAGLTYTSNTPSVGSYDHTTGAWTVGTLAAGAHATLTVVATVSASGSITNTAEVTASDAADPDSTPANHNASEDDQDSASITTTAATVGDLVYYDVDGDGTHDAGEPGLAGVDVTVRWSGPDATFGTGDDVVTADTTDASGAWSVTGLSSGTYRVSVDTADLPYGITHPTADKDGTSSANTADVSVAGGATVNDVDFGYDGSGTIGDTVFDDADDDGAPDSGEGLNAVTVNLTWFGPDDTLGGGDDITRTTTTDSLGAYSFTGLPAGTYRVAIDTASLPAGLSISHDPDGGADNHAAVTLSAGGTNLTQDFGYAGGGSIGDAVWSDTNGDGIQDTGEPGLGAVLVTLLRDLDNNGSYETTVRSALTSGAGTYSFSGLAPGHYRVDTTTPSGLTATTSTSVTVTLAASQTRTDVDMGFQPPAPPAVATIGDLVWDDANADGVHDGGETGVAGATVTLRRDTDGNGSYEATVTSTTTDGSGAYQFANLTPGNYEVVVTVPDGRNATTPAAVTVDLGSGDTVTDADFGVATAAPPVGSIGDEVWDDADADGLHDGGETGVDGVTVTLRTDPDGDGVFDHVAATTTTAGGGHYSFGSLIPTRYRVVVTPPGGTTPTTSPVIEVALTPGQTVTDADVGVASTTPATGSIGDRVWNDVNHDGVQDAGEPGMNVVTVTLLSDTDGDGTYETTVASHSTAGDGGYSFATLPAGNYLVVVTPPAGMATTTPSTLPVTLTTGQVVTTADTGLATPASDPFDLRLSVDLEGSATAGDTATWLLTVANAGVSASPDPVTVTDVLPAGLTYRSASGTGWSCSAVGQTVTCTRAGTLAVGASSQLRIVTDVTSPPGVTVSNPATVSAAGAEVTLVNNSDQAVVMVVAAPTTTTTSPATSAPGSTTPGSTSSPSTTAATRSSPTHMAVTGTDALKLAALSLALIGAGSAVTGARVRMAERRRRRGGSPS